jgi:hypothetical protein
LAGTSQGFGEKIRMKNNQQLEERLKALCSRGEVIPRTEKNQYLKVSYCGAGKLISPKWNVKIYTSGSIVCNVEFLLKKILENSFVPAAGHLSLIQIDDAGVGFPLCGAMVGVTDGSQIWTDTVEVSFFQSPKFERKQYLQEFANKGIGIFSRLGFAPRTHRVEICTGFINTRLRDALREAGFDVRVTEIKGLLQEELERLFKGHILKETGQDLAYDIKMIKNKEIPKYYYKVLEWGKKHAPYLLKSGWKSMQA